MKMNYNNKINIPINMVPSGHEMHGFSLVSVRWVTELLANSIVVPYELYELYD